MHELAEKIELMVLEFLLPLYFAQSGLRTQLWSLDTWALWGTCVALFVIACVAKFVPVLLTQMHSSICSFCFESDSI